MNATYETTARERVACVHAMDRFIAAAVAYGLARRHGLEHRAYCEVAIAAAELASNAVRHGGGGVIELRAIRAGARRGVELECCDQGPGIVDVERALRDGVSRGRELSADSGWSEGLGSGLGAVRRATNELEIETGPGRGTRVVARRWARVSLF
jgi:serine/threonine-protein kinase RsbT